MKATTLKSFTNSGELLRSTQEMVNLQWCFSILCYLLIIELVENGKLYNNDIHLIRSNGFILQSLIIISFLFQFVYFFYSLCASWKKCGWEIYDGDYHLKEVEYKEHQLHKESVMNGYRRKLVIEYTIIIWK